MMSLRLASALAAWLAIHKPFSNSLPHYVSRLVLVCKFCPVSNLSEARLLFRNLKN